MSVLLFAILDASHARSELVIYEKALRKAQATYDQRAATAEKRASSPTPEVRQRAQDALRRALDTLDEARAKLESEQRRSEVLATAEKQAYSDSRALLNEESAQLQQHRNCHA